MNKVGSTPSFMLRCFWRFLLPLSGTFENYLGRLVIVKDKLINVG